MKKILAFLISMFLLTALSAEAKAVKKDLSNIIDDFGVDKDSISISIKNADNAPGRFSTVMSTAGMMDATIDLGGNYNIESLKFYIYEVKETALAYLHLPIHEPPMSPAIVSHPFTNSGFYSYKDKETMEEVEDEDEFCDLLIELARYENTYARPVPSDFEPHEFDSFKRIRVKMNY